MKVPDFQKCKQIRKSGRSNEQGEPMALYVADVF
jgi:hypothetical protein